MRVILPRSEIPSLGRAEVMRTPHRQAVLLAQFGTPEGFFPEVRPEASIFAVWEAVVAVASVGLRKISHPHPIFEHS